MTVASEINHNQYVGNGMTTSFDYQFRVFKANHLQVQTTNLDGVLTTLVLNTDYTVTGVGSVGGKVVLTAPLANGWGITIDRDLPLVQETDLRNQGTFYAETHEDTFDYLTMLIQRVYSLFGLALRRPSWLSKFYDALGNRISNLGTPVNAQDAVTKKYTDDQYAGAVSHADDQFKRTLRVPESSIDMLPAAAVRRGKVQTYDAATGQPLLVPAGQLSIGDIVNLMSSDGLKYVGQCTNINELRRLPLLFLDQQVFLKEHTSGQGAGGGVWYCHSLTNNADFIDDNGCQIITNAGQVLRRKDLKHIHSSDFGVIPNAVVDEAYSNMAKAMRTFNKHQILWADPGENNGYFTYGGVTLGINHRKGVRVTGEGSGLKEIIFWHIGNNIGLRIYKDYKTAEEFWVKAIVENIAYVGVNSETDLSANMNPKATPFEFSDMWQPEFKNSYVGGYGGNTEGAAVSLYNKSAWTEGFKFDDLMIRQSCVGLLLHRDTSEGSEGTNSFFGAVGTLCMNAGVASPVTYVKVGDGTEAGSCVLYGHDIKIFGWMSRSSWHTGVMTTDYSRCSENGKFTFVWDGYGISSSATTEVLHLIRCQGLNSRFESDVDNYSGQSDAYPLSMRNLLYQTCMYSTGDSILESSYLYGAPVIQPRGLKIKMKGIFTAAQRQTGLAYLLNNLIPGQILAVTLRSWANDSKYKPTPQRWIVEVRGPDDPCIVTPNLAATPTLVGSVLTTPLTANAVYGSSLTLNNGNADNNVSYAVNSGRKINFVLPAFPEATLDMPYSVTIEVL